MLELFLYAKDDSDIDGFSNMKWIWAMCKVGNQ